MEFLGKSHLRLGGGRDWLMLEILVARVEVVPKVIPLIIIHKPVVALARHTRALHGQGFAFSGWTESDRRR